MSSAIDAHNSLQIVLLQFLLIYYTVNGQTGLDWSCDHDFVRIHNGCLKMVNIPATYDEAVSICKSRYAANLVSIHHYKENSELSTLGNSFLIGLRYYDDSGSLKWADKSEINFTRFDENELANWALYSDDCAIWSNGVWKMVNCHVRIPRFVCKKPLTTNPNNQCPPKDFVFKDNGTVYSPGWPREYHISNATCKYTLAVKLKYKIEATLKIDSLGTSNGCRDSVQAYEGWEMIPITAARIQGGEATKGKKLHIASEKNVLHFVFYYCPRGATRIYGRWKIQFDKIGKPPSKTVKGTSAPKPTTKVLPKPSAVKKLQITRKAPEVHKVTLIQREDSADKKRKPRNTPPISVSSLSYTGLCYQGKNALQKCGFWCTQKGKEFGSCILTGNFYKCWCFERVTNSSIKVVILEMLWWENSQRYLWYTSAFNNNNNRPNQLYAQQNYPYYSSYWNYNSI